MCPARRAAIVGGDFWGEVGCLRKSNKSTVTVTVTVFKELDASRDQAYDQT
jgi:hypothetical protein